ncbi:SKP1-like protein 1 [Zingiber officinale]|uniref:SKP1-like protein 1 n=1 Tax=Zingiber officinale TaxID=94328 RepID=UPI001C4CD002|nr:SKP1-like protein 1 [Zingiber officinale]
MASQTIKFMIEGNCGYGGIPITNVSSMILAKVIQYCEKNVNVHAMSSDDVTKPAIEELIRWDEEFVKVEESTLLHLVLMHEMIDFVSMIDQLLLMYSYVEQHLPYSANHNWHC